MIAESGLSFGLINCKTREGIDRDSQVRGECDAVTQTSERESFGLQFICYPWSYIVQVHSVGGV